MSKLYPLWLCVDLIVRYIALVSTTHESHKTIISMYLCTLRLQNPYMERFISSMFSMLRGQGSFLGQLKNNQSATQ